MRKVLMMAAAASVLGAISLAHAESGLTLAIQAVSYSGEVARGGESATVSYGDLNLTRSVDQERLRGRVANAVRRVCHYDPRERQEPYRRTIAACMAATGPAAQAQVTRLLSAA